MKTASVTTRYLKLLYPLLVAAVLMVPVFEASHFHDLNNSASNCLHCQSGTTGITSNPPSLLQMQPIRSNRIMVRAVAAPAVVKPSIQARAPPQSIC